MARPLNVIKKVRDAVSNVVSKVVGGLDAYFNGQLPLQVDKMEKFGQNGRMLAEKPSRDFDAFYFIHDVMANSPAVAAAVQKMSEDATLDENGDAVGLGFMVKAEPLEETEASAKKAREFKAEISAIVEDFIVRTGIGYNAKHYIEKMLYAGDCFAENRIHLDNETGLGRIELISELPTFQMRPNWTEQGELVGYTQRQFKGDRNPVVWDVPAQIIHWKYKPRAYFDLGRSALMILQSRWEAFKIIEMDLIAAIHTRAVAPEVHYLGKKTGLDTVSDEQIDEYYETLFENPADSKRYYVVREGQTRIEFPKTGDAAAITSLLDVWMRFERSFVEALGVPSMFAGEQASAKRRAAATAEQDYARRINSIRQDFSVALRPVILLELALQGYDLSPEGLKAKHGVKRVTITPVWPDLGETRTQKAARLAELYGSGMLSLETSMTEMGILDTEGEMRLIKAERDRGIWPLDKYTGAPDEGITPNGEQGKGVPADDGNKPIKKKKTTQAIRRRRQLLRVLLELDDE